MPKPRSSLAARLASLLASAYAAEIQLPGLAEPVELAIDQDGVPHVFAANDFDLARAQATCTPTTASSRWTSRVAR